MQKYISVLLLQICLQSFAQSKQITKLDSLLTVINKHKTDTIKVQLHYDISMLYLKLNDLKKGRAHSDSILSCAQKIKYKTGIALYYLANTEYHRATLDYSKAINTATKAKSLFYQSKNRKYFFIASSKLIHYLTITGKYYEAQTICINTLKYAQSLNDKSNMAISYNKLGLTYYFQTSYDKAIQSYKKALILASKTPNNTATLGDTYLNLSYIYSDLGQYNKALQNLDLSIKYNGNDELNKLRILQQKSSILGNMRQNEAALKLYLQISELIKKNGLVGRKEDIDNRLLLGCNYYQLGKFNQAIQYLTSVQDNYTFKDEQMSQVLIFLGGSYTEVGKLNDAKAIFNRLLTKMSTFSDPIKMQIYLAKTNLDAKLKNYESALDHYQLYVETKEKLEKKINEQQIQKLQVDFQVASKDIKIQKLKTNHIKNTAEIENKRIIIIALIILLTTLLVSSYLIFRAFRTIKRKNKIIEDKSKTLGYTKELVEKSLVEKDILLKEIHHRVKNNLQLIMSLLRVQGNKYDNTIFDDFLNISESRISSMALIHEKLYQSDDLTQINFNEYVVNMTNDISDTFQSTEDTIKIDFDLIPIKFDVQTLIPLALIINELVINAFKHAFKNIKAGRILIKLLQEEEKNILIISDNGAGITIDKDKKSIGLKLVKQLVFQLKAELEIKNFEGTQYQITFKTI
jgi:two-component system, sensor histidine kinase PdtaS